MTKTIFAADLFCGAGGSSTGLLQAADKLGLHVDLLAINHWQVAIAPHSTNHPDADTRCESLDSVDPRKAVPGGKLDLLVASPECTHHSKARGGKPMSDQSRASAWHVLRWCEALDVRNVLIENVPEFMDWGPLDSKDRPVKRQKGRIFRAFLSALRSLGYAVDYRVLNSADYGDATTRKRLFIMARKGGRKVSWPDATHGKEGADMFGDRPKWKPAREIINWNLKGDSIFTRKKPLSPNTLKRIEAGLLKYGGQAFVIGQQSLSAPRSVNDPIPTIATKGAISFVEPFIIQMDMGGRLQGIDEPMNTLTSADTRALVEPFIVPTNHGLGDFRTHSVNEPMPTITAFDALALAQPFLVEYHGGDGPERVKSLNDPLPTIDTSNRFGLVDPFLIEYYGTGSAESIDEPLNTITGRDRFGLVEPYLFQDQNGIQYKMDIRFRMLQPSELAAAMSFPTGYVFTGNREQQVKQIGNAVPVSTASALCHALLM